MYTLNVCLNCDSVFEVFEVEPGVKSYSACKACYRSPENNNCEKCNNHLSGVTYPYTCGPCVNHIRGEVGRN